MPDVRAQFGRTTSARFFVSRAPSGSGSHGLRFRVLASTAAQASQSSRAYVLIHGVGMSHRYFSRLHEELAGTDDVYSVDLPGFGGLPKPGTDLDVPAMAAALGGVLDTTVALTADEIILVGHSMGAQWAVELAAERPDLVHGVVIVGPVADERHRSLRAQSVALAVDTLGEPPSVNATVLSDYLRCGPRWYLRQAAHMLAYRLEDRVRDLRMPLLVVRGGDDPIAGAVWCRRLRDRAPRGSPVVVPQRNHVVQQTAPRAVADALRAWRRPDGLHGSRRFAGQRPMEQSLKTPNPPGPHSRSG
ncbi:alpha/beta fold hydrolase [Agromyces salentinus]|uniref:AB hydrolase-1 domain-containing protein n=1 Tax=Agromyces salentinus TaxID=269421 RepID=A0ABP4ZBG3_9MICO|nr:alpha/beta hydrolase [Agromyces salentinus]